MVVKRFWTSFTFVRFFTEVNERMSSIFVTFLANRTYQWTFLNREGTHYCGETVKWLNKFQHFHFQFSLPKNFWCWALPPSIFSSVAVCGSACAQPAAWAPTKQCLTKVSVFQHQPWLPTNIWKNCQQLIPNVLKYSKRLDTRVETILSKFRLGPSPSLWKTGTGYLSLCQWEEGKGPLP